MATGKVKMFNEEKGFGFLMPDIGEEELFMHRKYIKDLGGEPLLVGQKINYEIINGSNGHAIVTNIRRVE